MRFPPPAEVILMRIDWMAFTTLSCTGHAAPEPLQCIHGVVFSEHVTRMEVLLLLTLLPDSLWRRLQRYWGHKTPFNLKCPSGRELLACIEWPMSLARMYASSRAGGGLRIHITSQTRAHVPTGTEGRQCQSQTLIINR